MIPPKKKSESKQAKERAVLRAKHLAAGTVTAEAQNQSNWRTFHSVRRPKVPQPTTAMDGPAVFTLETREYYWSPEDQAEVDRIVGKTPQKV